MTISEHKLNVQTFLNYDFVKGPAQGRLLFVDKDMHGGHRLTEVNVNKLSFTDKISFFFSDGKKLEAIVAYVKKFLVSEARKAQSHHPEKWKMQFALLERKVEAFNQNHWFSKIEFDNPLVEKLKIRVTIPKIPESRYETRKIRRLTLKIPYTPLTTFEKVEEVVKKEIGPEGFLVDGESSDRSMIRNLASRKVRVCTWLSKNSDKELKIIFDDINIDRYVAYIYEKGYQDGYYKGYANGLFNSAPRTSRRVMMGLPELESSKVCTDKELFEKYS